MDRISGANYVTVNGKRQFQDLDLAASKVGTELPALWHNGAQESIIIPVEAVGLVPSDADNTQLLQAIKLLGAGGYTAISATPASPLAPTDAGVILVDASAGPIDLTLPAASAANGESIRYTFVRQDTSANGVSVAFHSGDTQAVGGSSTALALEYQVPLRVTSDGVSAWAVSALPDLALTDGRYSRPFLAPVYSLGGNALGANFSATQAVSFTAPSAGSVLALGKLNLNGLASVGVNCSLKGNGTQISGDNTVISQFHFAIMAVTAGEAVSVTLEVTTGTTDPGVDGTWAVAALFVPNG